MISWGNKKSYWSAAICLLFLTSIAAAAYQDTSQQSTMPSGQYNQTGTQSQATQQGETNAWSSSKGIHGRVGTLQSADKAIGMTVHNQQGDRIGTIKDLIVDKNRNTVSYVILSSGGKYYPVPWSAFSTSNRGYDLNVSKDGLQGAPTISSDDPSQLTSDVTQKAESFFSKQISASKQMGSSMGSTMTSQSQKMGTEMSSRTSGMATSMQGASNYLSCKKVIGMEVKNDQDKKIGEISDIVFDTQHGNIAYGITSFGGVLGVAKKTAAVPWSAIQLQPEQKVARLNASESTLTAAEINKDNLAKLNDPTFAKQIHQDFGQEPYWEVYGYVPPSGQAGRQAGMGMAAGAFATGAWAADSKYNRSFKPEEVTTVEGTIKSVGTFTPEIGAPQGMELKIETTNNETETIQLGPETWMHSQNIKFNEGDRVTVTGSKVRHGLTKVIMATDIQKGGQTLRVRDQQGNPLWTSSEMNRQGMSTEPNKGTEPNMMQ